MQNPVHCINRLWNGPLYPPEAPAVAALFALLAIISSGIIILLGLRAERRTRQQTASQPGKVVGSQTKERSQ